MAEILETRFPLRQRRGQVPLSTHQGHQSEELDLHLIVQLDDVLVNHPEFTGDLFS